MSIIIGIVVIFFIWVILIIKANNNKNDAKNEFLKQMGSDAKVKEIRINPNNPNGGSIFISNTGDILFQMIGLGKQQFHIKDVIGMEIIDDGKIVSSVSKIVTGGLLFGGVGAVVGALGQKKKEILSLSLKFDDFDKPQIIIPYGESKGSLQTTVTLLELVERQFEKK